MQAGRSPDPAPKGTKQPLQPFEARRGTRRTITIVDVDDRKRHRDGNASIYLANHVRKCLQNLTGPIAPIATETRWDLKIDRPRIYYWAQISLVNITKPRPEVQIFRDDLQSWNLAPQAKTIEDQTTQTQGPMR